MIEIVAAFMIGFIMGVAALIAVALHYGKEDKNNER